MLGASYLADIGDDRSSPAISLYDSLKKNGNEVDIIDEYITFISSHDLRISNKPRLSKYDTVILVFVEHLNPSISSREKKSAVKLAENRACCRKGQSREECKAALYHKGHLDRVSYQFIADKVNCYPGHGA